MQKLHLWKRMHYVLIVVQLQYFLSRLLILEASRVLAPKLMHQDCMHTETQRMQTILQFLVGTDLSLHSLKLL